MKRLLPMLLFAALIGGCAKTATPPPLPVGAYNQADATSFEILSAAHAAVMQYDSDVKAGTYKPSAAAASAYNGLAAALNYADPLWNDWHTSLAGNASASTATEPVNLVSAVSAVSSALGALNTAKGVTK